MIFTLVLFITALIPESFSEAPDGFYFTMEKGEWGYEAVRFQHQKLCITEEPFIRGSMVKSVSDVKGFKGIKYFDAYLSADAVDRISVTMPKLTTGRLLVVVGGKPVGFVLFHRKENFQSARFYAPLLKGDIHKIHSEVKNKLIDTKG